jgi:hypothetical protein
VAIRSLRSAERVDPRPGLDAAACAAGRSRARRLHEEIEELAREAPRQGPSGVLLRAAAAVGEAPNGRAGAYRLKRKPIAAKYAAEIEAMYAP